jgi:ferric-dicitrate binding protein FerR (iron transport regulator)
MKREQRHKKPDEDQKYLSDASFPRMKIAWGKSKDEIWEELSTRLEEHASLESKVKTIFTRKQMVAMAASLALLLSVAGFMRFYTIEEVSAAAKHTSIELPDGSLVELNASTTISYHPYWWRFSRQLDLEGEAFFTVTKGKQFQVVSAHATTEVVGTEFNVYARNKYYSVTCMSGQVRITSSHTREMVTLLSNERAELNETGLFDVSGLAEHSSPGWMRNHLMFTSEPLRLVFDEIERQFDISIKTPEGMTHLYSGNFSIDGSVENVISLICRPFDLEYEQISSTKYLIHSHQAD